MDKKLEKYNKEFIKYFIDMGIDKEIAEAELAGWLELSDYGDLDFENPHFDAQECISNWSE